MCFMCVDGACFIEGVRARQKRVYKSGACVLCRGGPGSIQ